MKKAYRSKLYIALFLLIFVFIAGVLGFKFISGYTLIDAIYMTVITITTVGFREVKAPDSIDKIFISLFLLSSLVILGYALAVITEFILSKNNIGNLRLYRVQKKVNSLNGHVIICGYGRNGKQAAQKLLDYKQPFVIVEINESVAERDFDDDIMIIYGNANDDEVLIRAGIERARCIICALPSDADNLFIVLSARQINPKLKIISRATQETSYGKLKLAGANNVIMPDKIGGDHMASLVVVPDLVEFLDNLSVSGDEDRINVEQVSYEEICVDNQELTINELDLRKKTGCSIIGYKSPDGEYIVNPEPTLILRQNSKLIVIGRPNQIEKLKLLYHA